MLKYLIEYDGGAHSVTILAATETRARSLFWARRDLPTLASPGEGRQITRVTEVPR